MGSIRQRNWAVFRPFGLLRTLSALGFVLFAVTAGADEVRYYVQDGITYMETKRVVQRPIVETRYEQREQIFYREQYKTDVQQSYQAVQVPVTEYRTMACLQNRWNPFAQPYYTYRTVPTQRMEVRQQLVQTPVTRRELVPEKRIVQIPITSQRLAQEEQITRVAVSAAPSGTVPTYGGTTITGPIGGIARLDSPSPTNATASATPQSSTFTPFTPQPATLARPSTAPSATPSATVATRPAATLAPSSSLNPNSSANRATNPGTGTPGTTPQTLSPSPTARPAASAPRY